MMMMRRAAGNANAAYWRAASGFRSTVSGSLPAVAAFHCII
jgi:hypothetical protein